MCVQVYRGQASSPRALVSLPAGAGHGQSPCPSHASQQFSWVLAFFPLRPHSVKSWCPWPCSCAESLRTQLSWAVNNDIPPSSFFALAPFLSPCFCGPTQHARVPSAGSQHTAFCPSRALSLQCSAAPLSNCMVFGAGIAAAARVWSSNVLPPSPLRSFTVRSLCRHQDGEENPLLALLTCL